MLRRAPAPARRARSRSPLLLKSASTNVWPKRKAGLTKGLALTEDAPSGKAASTSSATSTPAICERVRFTVVDYSSLDSRNAIVVLAGARSEFQAGAEPHHVLAREVDVRIVIRFPEPAGPVVVNAKSGIAQVSPLLTTPRLVNQIKGDPILGVDPVPPDEVRVLLMGVQSHIEDHIAVELVIVIQLAAKPQLHRFARIKEEVVERLQIGLRVTGDGVGLGHLLGV